MRLEKFRVANFRNINDSGWVEVVGTTALVGRNESGKTNLLQALRTISGPFSGEALSLTRDLPADRMRSEYSDDLEVVRTHWQLSEAERSELAALLPGGPQVTAVEVWRGYPPECHVALCVTEADIDVAALSARSKQIVARLAELTRGVDAGRDPDWSEALDGLLAAVARETEDVGGWQQQVRRALEDLDAAGRATGLSFADEVRSALDRIRALLAQGQELAGCEEAVKQWVLSKLPPFLYVDEYPDLDGQMDLRALAQRRQEGRADPSDLHFATLLGMAGIDSASLDEILGGDPEVRRQIVGRAGAGLTRRLRALWTDRALKVRFNLDGDHLQTLVCDPTSIVDIEMNLNQRSSGFRWFFSFFIMLSASRQNPATREAILLLDEPGLQLHAAGQRDLLRHLSEEIDNQSILATQSPFMIPRDDEAAVCNVRYEEERGTTVSRGVDALDDSFAPHAPIGSAAPVSASAEEAPPLQGSVPRALVNALFGTTPVLVVEQLSDLWYLSAISEHFAANDLDGLPEGLVLIPAGGASWVPHLLGLLGERPEAPVVLLTPTPPESLPAPLGEASLATKPVFIGEALSTPSEEPVPLERLVDPGVYERFVRAAYRKQLEERELEIDPSIEPLFSRYENALAALGLRFSRSQVARLAAGPSPRTVPALLARGGRERFARLFGAIRNRLEAAAS